MGDVNSALGAVPQTTLSAPTRPQPHLRSGTVDRKTGVLPHPWATAMRWDGMPCRCDTSGRFPMFRSLACSCSSKGAAANVRVLRHCRMCKARAHCIWLLPKLCMYVVMYVPCTVPVRWFALPCARTLGLLHRVEMPGLPRSSCWLSGISTATLPAIWDDLAAKKCGLDAAPRSL